MSYCVSSLTVVNVNRNPGGKLMAGDTWLGRASQLTGIINNIFIPLILVIVSAVSGYNVPSAALRWFLAIVAILSLVWFITIIVIQAKSDKRGREDLNKGVKVISWKHKAIVHSSTKIDYEHTICIKAKRDGVYPTHGKRRECTLCVL